MREALLEIAGLSAGYGDVTVLWDVDLEVKSGEIVALVGANGAGKTTLLNAVSGLVRRFRGTIRFSGQDLGRLSPDAIARLGIAHVPEGRRLFPGMTVRENLDVGAMTREARAHLAESLERVYALFPILKERSAQEAGTLSGGQQQMLAIARALMSRPKLLMIDEASLGLAPKVVDDIYAALEAIRKEGLTMLIVEQNVALALDVCHRAYVLENGRIALSGDCRSLKGDPRVQAAYLGG
ncbi:ABC transporter ATP-binding protein [Hydrogenibacillus sp. N12]|uniref:ABC transporter ATP-binding protein n=1 Tax=Hydrogenibacillus schlegelii TaxID=1484 RepID=A0A947CX35_HYDSH|nr:ABC transporter ATP-binding protein [Hydrogenibacillus sp. N12]MBE3563122.1 ABC transporter ATP-binding protein [Hydrogenibacillus schlegelii]MBT9282238.1 ABC transporter ATP-binding protein [Hydrogenibacillus schlegelii]QZA32400.1 ABC transporter ATP-binding protein [Hydrogenibacillus sp. N12]